jgi:hypothetical protein
MYLSRFTDGDSHHKLSAEILLRIGQWSRALWWVYPNGASVQARMYSPVRALQFLPARMGQVASSSPAGMSTNLPSSF